MGQAIVYCSNCSAQIRGADFEARRAFKVGEVTYCAPCCRKILGREPDPLPAPSSSTKVKAAPASRSSNTTRIGMVPVSAPLPPRPGKSGPPVALLAGAGIAAVAIVLALAVSGGSERRPSPEPTPAPLPSPAPEAARVSTREAAAHEALAQAIRFAAEHPQDLSAQRARFVEALARSEGTTLLEDARRELDRVDRKLSEQRAAELARTPKGEAAPQPPPADPPAAGPKPAPLPAAPARPAEDPARAARWEAGVAPATGRDYASALAALEKLGDSAPDLPLLRSASTLLQDALRALAQTPKGQKIALEVRDGTGETRRVEGSFAGAENGRVDLRNDAAGAEIDIGEILPSSLVELFRGRGGAVDPASAAVFCLLEGDEAGARRLAAGREGTIPDRYWAYARRLSASRSVGDAARALYEEALALAAVPVTAADAVPKYQSLLREHAESAFVRRNRASIASRAQLCARDYLFPAADLKSSGTFKAAKNAKGDACWTSEADSEAGKLKENFLELSWSVLADTPYKCWIYAGACCQETFEFWAQGTEMTGPLSRGGKEKEPVEPGSAQATPIKPWLSSLKKTHAAHSGPKQPSHWEWIPVPLPRYSKPGLQRLRILTGDKGFSVAFACVTALRTGPPREAELRDYERSRSERPSAAAVQGPKAVVLFACAFDGSDRRLVGELRDRALHGTTLFESCFTGVEGNPVFTMPAQGELRITYFLKSPSPLTARFRIVRGDKSVPYDAAVPDPVVGRPTAIRIPFSEFKPAYRQVAPPTAAGDVVPMVYFFGPNLDCGLRIDALSIVELRPEAPGPVVFSETFENGAGRFQGGEAVDGGVKGSKALSIPPKGVGVWGAWSLPAKDSVTISFKLKPLGDVGRIELMVWSEALNDNGRYFIDSPRKGEWQEVRLKAVDFRVGYNRDGPVIDVFNNIKIFFQNTPADVRVLLDDFEVRQ